MVCGLPAAKDRRKTSSLEDMEEHTDPAYAAYPRAASADPRQYYGPPDFRINALNEAWLIYKSDFGLWFGGYFLILIISAVAQAPASVYSFIQTAAHGPAVMKSPSVLMVTFLFGLIAAAVSGALHGGYLRLVIQKMRMRHEGFEGLFKANGQGWKLAMWSAIYSAPILFVSTLYNAISSGQADPSNPDLAALLVELVLLFGSFAVVQLLIFPFFLVPLILVDQKLSLAEAAAKSWQIATKMYFRALVFYIVVGIVAGSGLVLCGVGIIFTIPMYQLTLAVAYRDCFMPPIGAPPQTPTSVFTPLGPPPG